MHNQQHQPVESTVLLRLTLEEAQFIQEYRNGTLPTNPPFRSSDESEVLSHFCYSNPTFHRKQLQYVSASIIGYLGQEVIYQRTDYEEINESLQTFVDRLGELFTYCEQRFAGEHF